MRKFFVIFLGLVMSLALLTGCGKNAATPTTEYHGEGEIQGGIKSDEDIAACSSLFLPDALESSSPMLDWEWSMMRYESALSARVAQNAPGAQEAWDELEKSVVKNVADDVRVYIRSGTVELVILKKLA